MKTKYLAKHIVCGVAKLTNPSMVISNLEGCKVCLASRKI